MVPFSIIFVGEFCVTIYSRCLCSCERRGWVLLLPYFPHSFLWQIYSKRGTKTSYFVPQIYFWWKRLKMVVQGIRVVIPCKWVDYVGDLKRFVFWWFPLFSVFIFRCSMRNLLSDNLLWYIGTSGKRTLKK